MTAVGRASRSRIGAMTAAIAALLVGAAGIGWTTDQTLRHRSIAMSSGRHAHDGLVERLAALGAIEPGVAEGEDAAVRGHQPVAVPIGR
jgi:hypothetical protein